MVHSSAPSTACGGMGLVAAVETRLGHLFQLAKNVFPELRHTMPQDRCPVADDRVQCQWGLRQGHAKAVAALNMLRDLSLRVQPVPQQTCPVPNVPRLGELEEGQGMRLSRHDSLKRAIHIQQPFQTLFMQTRAIQVGSSLCRHGRVDMLACACYRESLKILFLLTEKCFCKEVRTCFCSKNYS